MAKLLDINEMEELRVKYFDYMSLLTKEIRILKFDIKHTQSLLNIQKEKEDRYVKFLISDNTGKGEYRDSQVLPNDIKDMIEKGNYSESEIELLKEKYVLALENAKKYEEEYKKLLETAIEREGKIKIYKKEVAKLKRELTKKEKEYNENMLKVKKLDRKMKQIQPEEEDVKRLVKKPIDKKEQ